MLTRLARRIFQQLLTLAVIMLILFAAALSLGRQFIPAVSVYKPQIEDWLHTATGLAVQIDSVTGRFEGFNPVLEVSGLRLLVPLEQDLDGAASSDPALEFDHALVILDVWRSLFMRRWELERFVVQEMQASAIQGEGGEWRLRGINRAGPSLPIDNIYSSLLQVSLLELRNLELRLDLQDGSSTLLHNGRALIQNRGGQHYFHIDANMEDELQPIRLSVEVRGNQLQSADGRVHLQLPAADYSRIVGGLEIDAFRLDTMIGSAEAWLELSQGDLAEATVHVDMERFSLTPAQLPAVSLEQLAVSAYWRQGDDAEAWQLAVAGLQFTMAEESWPPGALLVQGRGKEISSIYAERLILGQGLNLGRSLGLIGTDLGQQLEAYNPQGLVTNLSLHLPAETDSLRQFSFSANFQDIAVNSVKSSPALSGVAGRLQLSYDPDEALVSGRAEVDAAGLSINIPSVFRDTWQYDRVNGAVDFQIATGPDRRVHLVSNVIHAQSDMVDGRVQFESDLLTPAVGSPQSSFTLLIGAVDVDGSRKTPYLPSSPNQKEALLNTMRWLDSALLEAMVSQAGVIYRGSVLAGSAEAERTFQSFYDFSDGAIRYQEDWPVVTGANGRVLVRDREADIRVDQASSAGMALQGLEGKIRRREGSQLWLELAGQAAGATQDGINLLASAPLNLGLDQVMGDWTAEGQVNASLGLQIPLNVPGLLPQVQVSASITGNRLLMPAYQLDFGNLQGVVNYSTDTGLSGSLLESEFLGSPVQIVMNSSADTTGVLKNQVSVSGQATREKLIEWPGQPALVRALLNLGNGRIGYQAVLRLPGPDSGGSLVINSDLEGMALEFPRPLGKAADSRRPLRVELGIGEGMQPLAISYGADLNMRMQLVDGKVGSGVAYIGTIPGVADPWALRGSGDGLEIRGNLDNFVVSEWLDLLSQYSGDSSPAVSLRDTVSLINIDVGNLDLFGQLLPLLNVEIQNLPGAEYWTVGLEGESVAGSVLIPFDPEDYIEAYLAYLRLPGSEQPESVATEELPAESESDALVRTDPLAGMDPRRFPRLKFHTGSLRIGERDYGLGQFTLESGADGAEFTDLVGNFRGLQVGMLGDTPPAFQWRYDGISHHSYFSGIITARNIADVLRSNGFAETLESESARFDASIDWPGSPAFFAASDLGGQIHLQVNNGRFLQGGGARGALKLISILNFDAIMRRARFSDDLLRRGLAYDEISGNLTLESGIVNINDRLIISGPSSVYQITGQLDLAAQTIDGEMYLTLPVSDNIPWLGLLTANIPLAIGAYLFERIFGDQVDNLTSAQYTLQGPWDGLEPQFKQAFGSPESAADPQSVAPGTL